MTSQSASWTTDIILPTIYFPLVVHGALMMEPTVETESKEDLDRVHLTLSKKIAVEAKETPDVSAPPRPAARSGASMKLRPQESRVWRDNRMTGDMLSSVIRHPSSVLWYGVDLGILSYPDALSLQRKLVETVSRGSCSGVVLMLEHPPVFTLGQRGGMENLRVPTAFLEQSGISVIQAERGGSITYHGPGQLIVYPVIDLKLAGVSVTGYVEALEEVMIRTAGDWKISAGRNPAGRGVWVGTAKLGSIGIRVRRTVAFHGLALKLSVSLTPFEGSTPAGLEA